MKAVRLGDDAGLRALFAEQRARLEVVRDNGIWQWLGGVPSGFGHPAAVLYGVYLQIAFVCLVAIALVVAGFTRGRALWVVAGLAASCLLVRAMLLGPATRQTLSFYRSAVQVPGVMNSPLNDAEVAALMNWLLPAVSAQTLPAGLAPYTADEVARLRAARPADVLGTRRRLMQALPPPHPADEPRRTLR